MVTEGGTDWGGGVGFVRVEFDVPGSHRDHWPGERDQGVSPLSLPPSPGLSHPFSIDVFEDYIYGVTYINNRVFKIHKFGHSPLTNLTGGLSHASDVVLYHQHKQPEGGYRGIAKGGPGVSRLWPPVLVGREGSGSTGSASHPCSDQPL